jgi:hypothetical protein
MDIMHRIYYVEMLDPEFHDLEVLVMLGKKTINAMRKKHATPFHNRLPICDLANLFMH